MREERKVCSVHFTVSSISLNFAKINEQNSFFLSYKNRKENRNT